MRPMRMSSYWTVKDRKSRRWFQSIPAKEVVSYEEILTPVKTTAVEGQVSIHVDTDEEFTEGGKHERTYRVVTEQKSNRIYSNRERHDDQT